MALPQNFWKITIKAFKYSFTKFGSNSDVQQALDADPLAGFELSLAFGRKPHPSTYENLTIDQVRGKLSETYETLFGAIEIGANDEVPRLIEALKCLNSRLEELGYPEPSKLSAQITMTRARKLRLRRKSSISALPG